VWGVCVMPISGGGNLPVCKCVWAPVVCGVCVCSVAVGCVVVCGVWPGVWCVWAGNCAVWWVCAVVAVHGKGAAEEPSVQV